jgi:hypothetical protein
MPASDQQKTLKVYQDGYAFWDHALKRLALLIVSVALATSPENRTFQGQRAPDNTDLTQINALENRKLTPEIAIPELEPKINKRLGLIDQ